MKISEYRLTRLRIPLREPIGDSQVCYDVHWMTVLELITDNGLTGTGFQVQQGEPTAGLKQITEQFEFTAWPNLKDAHPVSLAMRMTRPRGGSVSDVVLPLAVETALWDLAAKSQDLPLYKYLGGTEPRVAAYGSTLDFHLSDNDFRAKVVQFADMGFRAIKIKVGHPDIQWDLKRMRIVHDVMGSDVDLMVDSNEAWSPKETILRANTFRDAGFNIYWFEDPITREDFEGYALLSAEIPFARINTGEYLGFSGKRRLLENHAVDVLNIHDSVSSSRASAHLAGDYGIPICLGNTILELGVHLAASLPECLYLEFSDLMWNDIAVQPVQFERGQASAPDRPGHGIELDPDKVASYTQAD